ncbi:MAG: beta-ketoacyl-ACP synthase III [Opitutales bacterium]
MPNGGPSIVISGTGSHFPDSIVTNEDLARRMDTSDEWIQSRTGIRERRIAVNGTECSDMATIASERALRDAGLRAEEIDAVIVGTLSPDMLFPATACLVQKKLGLRHNIPAFDLSAACSGFLYALEVGSHLLLGPQYRNALIIGAEKISSVLDWQDRSTCVLFGDAAGATVLTRRDESGIGILGSMLGADGENAPLLSMPGGGSARPASVESLAGREHFLKMNGRELFKMAVRVMQDSAVGILERHGLSTDDIACVIPHQANIRIIDAVAQRLGMPMDKFYINLDRFGNTSAASIPLALDEAKRAGRIRPGDYILFVAFGAGLTWGATLVKWH